MLRRLLRGRLRDEAGATMIIVGGSFVALMAIAALVIDLGLVRMHRSQARAVVDASAAAGALQVKEGDGRSGCLAALGYAETNLFTTFGAIDCTSVPASCAGDTAAVATSDSSGDWELTITYPVPDDHPLMSSSVVGSDAQPVDEKDGLACNRIGVSLVRTHQTVFGSVVGQDTTTTEVRATGVTRPGTVPTLAVNLVILERYDCDALVLEGGGSSDGGIYIDVVEQADGSITPGHATVDSDGTGAGCGGDDGTVDGDGSNSIMRADGLPGCPEQTGTHTGPGGQLVGESCGKILLFADGTPGCNLPACSTKGTISPDPTPLINRVTRAPVDHRYNCKSSYGFPAGWEIPGCADSTAPYIDNLVAAHGGSGAPPGFKTWSGLGHKCTVEGSGTVLPVNGDVYVDCDPLYVKANVHFTGGDVVFAGDVIIESNGFLAINGEQGGDPLTPGLDSVTVFLRDGRLRKAGQADLVAHNTMVYMSSTSELQMEGGTGTLIWTAASTGKFNNLALWSESASIHDWAGQAFLDLQGIFFSPHATVAYKGSGGQVQVKAQFVTLKLRVSGNGILSVSPRFNTAVLVPEDVVQLIR